MRWSLLICCAAITACVREQPSAAAPLLYVWAGDADTAQPDFLAVIDADTASATYGRVMHTAPVDSRSNGPHHTEHDLTGNTLYANGWGSGRTFVFDVSDRQQPRLLRSFDSAGTWRYPHSFARLPNGNVLATFQSSGDSGYTASGGLVELDSANHVVRAVSGAAPGIPANETWTYSLLVLPDLDRIVSTNTRMGMSPRREAALHAAHRHVAPDVPSFHVQIWRLSDLTLLSTVRLPDVPGGQNANVAEARRTANGEVFVNTFSCGVFRIHGLMTNAPRAEAVFTAPFRDPGYCAVPVVLGNYWIQPQATERAIVSLDMSDPGRPREVSRITLDSTLSDPHWLGLDSAGGRIVATSSGQPWVMMLTVDRATGRLAIDQRFGDGSGARAGVISFDRAAWPHGESGRARPHGAVFTR